MSTPKIEISDEILALLRKIVRAMDLQSRQLQRSCALTSPQLVLLREIVQSEETAIGTLANHVSLSNATVTGIVDRLEQRGLVARSRNSKDRRQVLVSATATGRALCRDAPSLMQEKFLAALSGLQQWEQAQIMAALSHLAAMMNGMPEASPPTKDDDAVIADETASDGFIASCQMLLEKEPSVAKPQGTGREGKTGIPQSDTDALTLNLIEIHSDSDFPASMTREGLARFLHEHLQPYQDSVADILRGLDYALSPSPDRGGFILLALLERGAGISQPGPDGWPVGALVMLNTGMAGYVPEHLLLFVAVDASLRGRGVGAQLIRRAQRLCMGDVKLHVEYDNPARRLYERMGFSSKYADMRWKNE